MLSKNSTSYDIFFLNFGKKARVYYTLSISRGGAGPRPPPGFATVNPPCLNMDLRPWQPYREVINFVSYTCSI